MGNKQYEKNSGYSSNDLKQARRYGDDIAQIIFSLIKSYRSSTLPTNTAYNAKDKLFREEGAAIMGNLAQLDTIMNDLIHMGDGKPFDDPFVDAFLTGIHVLLPYMKNAEYVFNDNEKPPSHKYQNNN